MLGQIVEIRKLEQEAASAVRKLADKVEALGNEVAAAEARVADLDKKQDRVRVLERQIEERNEEAKAADAKRAAAEAALAKLKATL
jgi:hypothetical protein